MTDDKTPFVTIPVPIKCETIKGALCFASDGCSLAEDAIGAALELTYTAVKSRVGTALIYALFVLADAALFFILGSVSITGVIAVVCGYGHTMMSALPEWMFYAGGACGVSLRWGYIILSDGYIKFKCITGETE